MVERRVYKEMSNIIQNQEYKVSKQASNIYFLTQVDGLAIPNGTNVDLRLGCPD